MEATVRMESRVRLRKISWDFLAKHGNSKWKAALDTDKAILKYGIIEVDSTVIII